MGSDRLPAALFLAAVLSCAQTATAGGSGPGASPILDVPFLPQSEQLCGGAAAAMVLRYWGERDVFAGDFAPLVSLTGSGIRSDVLAGDLRRRGWLATPLTGDEEVARDHLARQRPLIALIEDQPGRYHYVVLVGWHDGQVILHDPARAPFRVVAAEAFTAAWQATDFWTLLILPDRSPATPRRAEHGPIEPREATRTGASTAVCDALVSHGVRLAREGDRLSADGALSTALERCPGSALAARELAGLRFLESRWGEAAGLAARAAAHAPDDPHAWRLLGASRFLQDDPDGALEAWNQAGEPRIDLVRIHGLDRTRHAVVQDVLGLEPRTTLTAAGLRRARRRRAMLPAASASRVGYRPVPGGLAEIEAAIVDRRADWGLAGFALTGAHALIERELRVGSATPGGGGARWSAGWRWWEARPRVGLSLMAPAAFGVRGLWQLEGFWERQSYEVAAQPDGEQIVRQDRKRAALTFEDWLTADTRLGLGVAHDRWNGAGSYVSLSASLERRLANDRLAAIAETAWWASPGLAPFGTGAIGVFWRSAEAAQAPSTWHLTARMGLETASARSPLDVWPGADVGHARQVFARAHPLLHDGVVSGGLFGRTLAHGGIELHRRIPLRRLARPGFVLFSDAARARHTLGPAEATPIHVDVGVGLRFGLPGEARSLRIDLAHGLRDGHRAISAGWQLSWPHRQ